MSSAGTTFPGRTWVSSKPPNFVTHPNFRTTADNQLTPSPDLYEEPSSTVKYDPERPGGTIFTGRTLNTFKKKTKQSGILKNGEGQNKRQAPPVRFIDDEDNIGREVVTTTVGSLTIKTAKSYEALIAERDALLESDGAYRRRINQLEDENTKILLDYEGVYKENNILREKLDKGDDSHIESYQRVYDDRQILREAETAYKRRINQLEHDAKEMLTNFESLYSENKVLRDKSRKLEDRLNSIDRLDEVKKMNELEKKVKSLEKTVRTMGYEREELVKENREIENQKYKLREDIADLQKRNSLLERENEGFKRGFMALGQNAENRWKDEIKEKTRRQQEEERLIREEHAQFKKDIEGFNKEIHNLEKINIELKTRNDMLQGDKDDFEKRLFEMARESGKRTPSAVKRQEAEKNNAKDKKIEELQINVNELKEQNVKLQTKTEVLEKEKETFDQRMEEAKKQPRETASSIRRKMETEREIRDLNMHVENFKEKAKRLEVENEELKEDVKKLEVETKAQRQAANAMATNQANQMDTQVKSLNETIIKMNNEIKVLTEDNLKLKTDYNVLEEKFEEQLEAIKLEKKYLLEEKQNLQKHIESSSSNANSTIKDLQDTLNSLQVELQLLKPKHNDLIKAYEDKKAENKSLSDQLDNKNNELEQLKENIRNNKDVYNELSKVRRENADLKREIQTQAEKFKAEQLKQEADLEELLKNQEFMNTALAEHKVRLDMLQQEKNDLKSENVRLIKSNERQAKTIADLEVDITKTAGDGSTKQKALETELEELKKEYKKNEKELFEAKQENQIAKNERENQVNKLMKQLDKLKTERETETAQLKEQSDSLKSEVARLKIFEEKISSMESNLHELVSKLRETEDRNKQLTNEKLASLHQVLAEMKNENLANRLRAAEREQNELEKHRLELEIKQDAINEIRKLKDENHRLMGLLEDKRAAEQAQDEWTKKRNKFNEIVAQNARLQDENKRLLSLFENSQAENMKKDLQVKTEKLKLMETKFQEYTVENANLKKVIQEKEIENKRIGEKADRSQHVQQENNKLKLENQRLRDEGMKKDSIIASLKELEVAKSKYLDSAANNQRLYEENMRLRETIEKSKDYKSEFQKVKEKEKKDAVETSRYAEEITLLKNTIQVKETELRREIELQKDRASNLQIRNKRLVEELGQLKADLLKKDDLIIKLRELENVSKKMHDATSDAARLYDENQRLRNLLENQQNSGWKSNFQNAKSLSADKKQRKLATAIYVESAREKGSSERRDKLLKERAIPEHEVLSTSSTPSDPGQVGSKMKIKPLLPDIKKEGTGLLTGLSYQELHAKTQNLKGQKLIDELERDALEVRSKLVKKESDIRKLKEKLEEQEPEIRQLVEDKETLKAEIARLKKELEVKAIGDSMSRSLQLQEQNRRLDAENQRLREEISVRDIELANRGAPGYQMANFIDGRTDKTTEEKLKISIAENRRLLEENNRLRAALDETHTQDTGSRFAQPSVTGSMIEGFKTAKTDKTTWASTRSTKHRKGEPRSRINETDEMKMLKIEEIEPA
ncbi:myosin-11-like [Dreissena polymorpha]|uniref:Uncharacterized protein n=1 Tax=Dreissena polymorpha TaxID=45954 RepID=A0A9D4RCJ4_DREPO|nr:myosin-11-like [Dreissena polymorpha]KAH3861345.1 hypothetical protein DPMN_024272 [Dreissena polymorpha]